MRGRGFTLIEMLVVLFIIGAIFALALPRFTSGYQIMTLRMASQTVAQTLQLAQQYAISCGTDVYAVFPVSTSQKEFNLKSLKVFNPETGRSITAWKILPKGISISGDPTQSTFIINKNTINIPFPEDNNTGTEENVYFIRFKAGVGTVASGNVSVTLVLDSDPNVFQKIVCYNTTREIKIKGIKEP